MHWLDIIVAALLIIGGINWGLVGFFEFNLVAAIFGEGTAMSRVIYALVGLSALYEIFEYTVGFRSMQHRWCDLEAPATSVRH
ncbi:DUF378 domain-containing protein [Geomonas sp. RF6]|nr:DUF378 domain-containing protein [Geomonas sp. RF6]